MAGKDRDIGLDSANPASEVSIALPKHNFGSYIRGYTETSIPYSGPDSEGRADQMSGAITRRLGQSPASEDADPGALSDAGEEGQEE